MPPPPGRPRRAPAPESAGRHRRPHPLSRPVLLTVLGVLVLLLGSGTAISLTAAAPARSGQSGPPTSGVEAFGAAPESSSPSPSAAESDEPTPEPEPEPEPSPKPEPDPADNEDEPIDEITRLEDKVTAITNEERAEAGCGELATDERLRTAARGHSEDMAANDYFDHTGKDSRSPFERMADAGYPDPAGENIAAGYRTPAEVMQGWMESDGHRENLLNCSYQAIGVGLAYDGNGRPYWTQDFGR